MIWSWALFGLVLSAPAKESATANEGPYPQENGVLILTGDNFDEVLRVHPTILVMFYAPWCGHCKQLGPVYAEAAKTLQGTSPAVPLGKIDATAHGAVAEKYQIQGYPSLKLFVNGSPIEYTGGRTAPAITTWVMKKIGPVTQELNNLQEYQDFMAKVPACVACLTDTDKALFEAVARNTNDVNFATSNNPDVCKLVVGETTQPVRMRGPAGESPFEGQLTEQALKDFVRTNRMPLVVPFDGDVAPDLFSDGRPLLFLVRSEGSADQEEIIFNQVAKDFRGRVVFSIAGTKEPMDQRLMDYIGIGEDELPAIRLIKNPMASMTKYKLDGDITLVNLRALIEAYFQSALRPFLKSDPVPEQTGPVRQLVGSTFADTVFDATKDVLVQFYAPWCGHCKKFGRVYTELAQTLAANHPNTVIAKMDATSNDVDGVEISGFPSLLLWRADQKNTPVEYDGERTITHIIQWLEEKGSAVHNGKDEL